MSVESSAAVGPPPGMAVRLSSNESPFGPSPAAVDAMREAAATAHLYPDDQSIDLRAAIAAHEGATPDQVTLGTGSAAILMDLIAHDCAEGGAVLAFERAFIVYRLGARNAGADYVEATTGGPASGDADGYARDPADLLARIADTTRVVIVDNPGNPTGSHLTGDELTALVAGVPEHVTVVIDEAYHQFAVGQRGYATVDELGLEHPRLTVLRTFSKAYALAGLRVGYLLGPRDLVVSLDAYRSRFNVNSIAQAAAVAVLADHEHLAATVEGTRAGRDRMVAALREQGIPLTDGLGNFVTIELGEPSGPYVEAFAEHGVGVRPLLPYAMTEQLRITVGTDDEIEAFLTAAATVLDGAAARR